MTVTPSTEPARRRRYRRRCLAGAGCRRGPWWLGWACLDQRRGCRARGESPGPVLATRVGTAGEIGEEQRNPGDGPCCGRAGRAAGLAAAAGASAEATRGVQPAHAITRTGVATTGRGCAASESQHQAQSEIGPAPGRRTHFAKRTARRGYGVNHSSGAARGRLGKLRPTQARLEPGRSFERRWTCRNCLTFEIVGTIGGGRLEYSPPPPETPQGQVPSIQ